MLELQAGTPRKNCFLIFDLCSLIASGPLAKPTGCEVLVPRLEWLVTYCAVVAELADAPA